LVLDWRASAYDKLFATLKGLEGNVCPKLETALPSLPYAFKVMMRTY
jgi:hypothetical protein